MKVRIKGYQSIRDEINLEISGYTCLTGESNRGKSAVIRAIQSALSNEAGTDFLTVGEEECEIEIEVNGHTLLWKKGKKSPYYEVDGKPFNKVGRNLPDEVAILGIKEIVTNDKAKHWPQIQDQLDGPFILAESSPATTAELIGANEDTLILMKAIRLAKEDTSKAKSLEDLLGQQLKAAQDRLSGISSKERLLDEAEKKLDQSIQLQEEAQQKVDVLEDLKSEWERNQRAKKVIEQLLDKKLVSPPNPTRAKELERLYTSYIQTKKAASIKLPDKQPECKITEEQKIRLQRLKILFDRYNRARRLIVIVSEAEGKQLRSTEDLISEVQKVEKLGTLEQRYREQTIKVSCLGSVAALQTPNDRSLQERRDRFQRLKDLQRKYGVLTEAIHRITREQEDLDQELKSVEARRQRVIGDLGQLDYCMLCGTELGPGKVREHLETVGLR